MTISIIEIILDRLKETSESSPLAVFKVQSKDKLNAVFANTVTTQKQIVDDADNFVGLFHKDMNMLDVKLALLNAL